MIDYDKPDDDPIVAEVRRAREKIAASFNYDLKAIIEDARQRTEAAARAGKQVVDLAASRHRDMPKPPSKRAG